MKNKVSFVKKFKRFGLKIAKCLFLTAMKDLQATQTASGSQNRTSSTIKHGFCPHA
jgi:hypothetical protein